MCYLSYFSTLVSRVGLSGSDCISSWSLITVDLELTTIV